MRKMSYYKIIMGILMVFILSIILPSCATTSVSSSEMSSRKSLMMRESVDRSNPKSVRTAKASRSYKKSKKRSEKFKKQKHKYKKRRR